MIIQELTKLQIPAEPLTFLTPEGPKTEEGQEIIEQIKQVLIEDPTLNALAAPMIGINKRIFCIKFQDNIKTFINPIITKKRGLKVIVETTPVLPGKEIVVGRPEEITAVYYNDTFKYEDNKLSDAAAWIFDQMCNFLDGITPDLLGMVSDLEADGKIEEEDIPAIIDFYHNTFIPTRQVQLRELAGDDEETKKIAKQLKFTEEVINGRIEVVESEEDSARHSRAQKMANKAISKAAKTEAAIQKAEFKNFAMKTQRKHKK